MDTRMIAKSYHESGNLTRGQYGEIPILHRVSYDYDTQTWNQDKNGLSWAAWDSDYGWIIWPHGDVSDNHPEQTPIFNALMKLDEKG